MGGLAGTHYQIAVLASCGNALIYQMDNLSGPGSSDYALGAPAGHQRKRGGGGDAATMPVRNLTSYPSKPKTVFTRAETHPHRIWQRMYPISLACPQYRCVSLMQCGRTLIYSMEYLSDPAVINYIVRTPRGHHRTEKRTETRNHVNTIHTSTPSHDQPMCFFSEGRDAPPLVSGTSST